MDQRRESEPSEMTPSVVWNHVRRQRFAAMACVSLIGLAMAGCAASLSSGDLPAATESPAEEDKPVSTDRPVDDQSTELATFGAGCFWCVEAVFQQLKGVISVESGYSGGQVPNPTYEQVCQKNTGHAEVCQIRFDPTKIRYEELLEVFWKTHDPTTPNQQGADVGPQYRSAIFYHNEKQRELAEKYKRELDAAGAFSAPIVTEISPFKNFYVAEEYHQNYYRSNPYQGYCRVVIQPKVDKFRKVFADKLKPAE